MTLYRPAISAVIPILFLITIAADPSLSADMPHSSAGCRFCHRDIAVINQAMQPWLLASARQLFGKDQGYECSVCHDGNPDATEKKAAHMGMAANPSSMWVLHQGRGCARCHDGHETVTTIMGRPLDKPVGGEIMTHVSEMSDPSGKTGINYTYRMARSLMALETGKANKTLSSNGIIPKGTFPYADFNMDDPDGAVPVSGSRLYRQWIKKALEAGFIQRLSQVREIPDFEQGKAIFKSEEKAGFADIHRKQCGRCHVWGEGRGKRGDRRAAGCAACHVLYNNDGTYQGMDQTVKANTRRFHPVRHRITTAIPAQQCTHCHTRGKRIGTTFTGMFEYDYVKDGKAPPFNRKGEAQKPLFTKEYMHVNADIHFQRGMQCVDCHTSIDVHGDGNIYPVTWYQVEVSCSDCHGTPGAYPWELPVGYGSPVMLDGPRGIFTMDGTRYLLTSRGNARKNWIRKGNRVFVKGLMSGKEYQVPMLKNLSADNSFRSPMAKTAMVAVPHLQHLECYTCHSSWAPQCFGCHIKYDRRKPGTDWIITSRKLQPENGRQTITPTPGNISMENRSFLRWEQPMLGVNFRGRVSPLVPGCQVFYTFVDENGTLKTLNRHYNTSSGQNSPTLAPEQPHSVSLVARTCEDCHTSPRTLGYGTGNTRTAYGILGERPLLTDMSKGIYGDIPGGSASWQVPPVKDFPFSLEQLVTRDGKQVQNMPLPADRPLDRNERLLVEREGVCAACHRHTGTEKWQQIIKRYGRAHTPEEHDKIMEKALNGLIDRHLK